MSNDDLPAGTIIGRYALGPRLGVGGMGAVYRARDAAGREVALKIMLEEAAARPVLRKRFLREARAAMTLPHPNIVTIYEVVEPEGLPAIAMELLDGESLEQLLEHTPMMDVASLARMFVHVTSAVGTAHALGIVHRDLKPDNIFVTRAGIVKVLDFGIAKFTATEGSAVETQALTKTGTILGTPYYMSPEQAFGDKRIDHRADIWSLGIILYRCLSGILPTRADSLGEVLRRVMIGNFPPLQTVAPHVPHDLARLVEAMLQGKREDRPWDLRPVHATLERHASVSAPAFGVAVEPTFDDASSTLGEAAPSKAPAPPAPSRPALALAPKGLRLTPVALVAGRPGASQPGLRGVTPTGTLQMEPPSQGEAPSSVEAGAPAPSRAALWIGLALAALVVAGGAVAMLASR